MVVCALCSVVKEEIVDDNARLPCFNGRVVCWVRCFFSFLCVDDIDNEILSWNSEIFMWYLKIHPTLLRDAMLVRYMLALCVSLSVRLSIRMSVFHKLALYQNG